jgi:putative aminopeptidase FrvX
VKDLIKKLTEAYGPSGHEEQIREVIRAEVESLADEVRVDTLGNLIARKRGSGGGKKVMLAAHMDEIGLIVSYVDEKGFLRVQPIGGVDLTTLAGGRVQFADGTLGVIAPEDRTEFKKNPELSKLYVDIGATSRDEAQARLGEAVCFVRPFADLGQRVVAKAFDDRIACAVLVEVLRRLGDSPHDVYCVFSVQEEVGLRGAHTSAYGIEPDLGLAVDITASADTPEAPKLAMKLGAGPCIKVMDGGMLAHPGVKNLLIDTAEANHIPYQLEVLDRGSTDAAAMQLARSGVPAGCVSIACRYYHTPSEMVDMADVENSIKLLLAVLQQPIQL